MSAAVVTMIQGKSYALREGKEHYLAVHSDVQVSDTVRTEADAKLVMRFADGATVHLGPSTRVAIQEYLYDPQGGTEPSFALDMLTGAVRSVSGKIVEQNPEAFKLKAPLGTVGIRGTTTLHLIYADREVHIVESIDKGHTVVINTPDGRSISLSLSATGVTIMSQGLEPLVLEQISPGKLQEILREWLDEGNVSQLMDSFLTAETAAFIEKLADLYIKGQLDIAELHDPAALAASLSDEFGGLDAFSLVSDMDDLRGLFGEYLVTGYDDDLSAPVSIVGPVGPASPIGPVMIYGTAGNDLLIGTSGNDWVSGGSGNDYIWTGTGNDTVFGGYGSSDTLIKPDMAAGSYLYGDGDTLNLAGTTLDDDLIFVGSTSELEVPDIAFDFINDVEDIDLDSYVAGGNMSGGEIYGDGHTVLGTGWCGDDTIVVQGTMSGGVIYGDAHTAGSGVTLGNDDITVGSMSGGVIYGDAATYDGPANPGSNMIEVSSMMSGGVIYGGEGNDDIKVNNLSGSGVIYGGAGNDIITITGTMSGGEIHTGTGSDEVNIGTVDGTCKIICGDGMDSITIGDVIGGALIIEGFDYAAVDNDIFSFDQTDWVLDRASLAYDYALLEHSTSGATITFIDGKDLVNLFAV